MHATNLKFTLQRYKLASLYPALMSGKALVRSGSVSLHNTCGNAFWNGEAYWLEPHNVDMLQQPGARLGVVLTLPIMVVDVDYPNKCPVLPELLQRCRDVVFTPRGYHFYFNTPLALPGDFHLMFPHLGFDVWLGGRAMVAPPSPGYTWHPDSLMVSGSYHDLQQFATLIKFPPKSLMRLIQEEGERYGVRTVMLPDESRVAIYGDGSDDEVGEQYWTTS